MTASAVASSFRIPTLTSVVEFDSYGGVVILILLTYVLSVNLTMSWGPSVILVVQIATVSVILRISRAPTWSESLPPSAFSSPSQRPSSV